MFEILPRDWNLKPIFTQKWASVDMNWGFNPPTIQTLPALVITGTHPLRRLRQSSCSLQCSVPPPVYWRHAASPCDTRRQHIRWTVRSCSMYCRQTSARTDHIDASVSESSHRATWQRVNSRSATTTRLSEPFASTAFVKRAFRCSAPATRKSLPQTVTDSNSLGTFKSRLNAYLFFSSIQLIHTTFRQRLWRPYTNLLLLLLPLLPLLFF